MATFTQRRPYSALDLPHPTRDGLVFLGLAVAALALDADPSLPWAAGVAAAALFAVAGIVRTAQAHRELVRWRAETLTARPERDRMQREVGRTLHMLDPRRLPSASPLRRPEARAC